MFIKRSKKASGAWTLAEMLIGMSVFSISGIALSMIFLFSIKSFAAMANYMALDEINRHALDTLTRDIRQARAVVDCSTNSITVIGGSNESITYYFDMQNKQFIRSVGGGQSEVLLTDCNLLTFNLFQRNPINGTYDIYPAATNNWQETVKVVQLSWKTSRTLPHGGVNSENVQTARIVIRKKVS